MINRRPFWLFPIFQIPLLFCGMCLITAALFSLLNFGKPQVAVAIALDLSGSTYDNQFDITNQNTVLYQEIQAVRAYLQQNNPEILRSPNLVRVFGFGGVVKPLTKDFTNNSKQVEQELLSTLQTPGLAEAIQPNNTNINLAIETGIQALKTIPKGCRELILVTDGRGTVSPTAIRDGIINQIKINSVVLGGEAVALRDAAVATRGIYLSGSSNNLSSFFTDNFFTIFNSNLKWIIFWLGLAWIFLMWTLVLPLDRIVFQGLFQMTMDISGKLAIAQALFWTVVTLSIIWRFFLIPFLSGC